MNTEKQRKMMNDKLHHIEKSSKHEKENKNNTETILNSSASESRRGSLQILSPSSSSENSSFENEKVYNIDSYSNIVSNLDHDWNQEEIEKEYENIEGLSDGEINIGTDDLNDLKISTHPYLYINNGVSNNEKETVNHVYDDKEPGEISQSILEIIHATHLDDVNTKNSIKEGYNEDKEEGEI